MDIKHQNSWHIDTAVNPMLLLHDKICPVQNFFFAATPCCTEDNKCLGEYVEYTFPGGADLSSWQLFMEKFYLCKLDIHILLGMSL